MTEQTRSPRAVDVQRVSSTDFRATNERGGEIAIGTGGDDLFTPVELLLAAIAACGSIDVDMLTTRRAVPDVFAVEASGTSVKDETGNRLEDIRVTFDVRFPEGEDGDRARRILDKSIERARDVLCTVSRTVALGTPVEMVPANRE
ncbi:OsmC family protein [Tessaracoccus sp. MC1865]|uniref:OsmC family protein n=1 Tax=Tessaracoccus sp. MC1865 TaxID=2760310 RepID=UPI00160284E5|nr:OsmC family protein [Tessaracoccus sp. MC1865]MBB1483240.1 OsmC family protein [Tessaracoccus sp. MC1865]QTO37347.1 OsmC family protein [Tessaracoccus sp. MC1865]